MCRIMKIYHIFTVPSVEKKDSGIIQDLQKELSAQKKYFDRSI